MKAEYAARFAVKLEITESQCIQAFSAEERQYLSVHKNRVSLCFIALPKPVDFFFGIQNDVPEDEIIRRLHQVIEKNGEEFIHVGLLRVMYAQQFHDVIR